MHNKIEYISPNSFHYWENCPLKGLYSKSYKDKQLFPKHPDADIGTLIHEFYERHREWKINSVESFNAKWELEINNINEAYKKNFLQNRYYPIQWHSKFYGVKKQLLYANLIKSHIYQCDSTNRKTVVFEEWINNQYLGGYVDLIIKEDGKVKRIVDFKTGNIFEVISNQKIIKEAYKEQLALYCVIVTTRQAEMPELFLETLNGQKYPVKIHTNYLKEIAARALNLKEKINKAVEIGNTDSLAKCNTENCVNCNYRMFCISYKNLFLNKKCGKRIDLHGVVRQIGSNEIRFDTGVNLYIIKNTKVLKYLSKGEKVSIYNLFYPNEDELTLYSMNNTIVYNE